MDATTALVEGRTEGCALRCYLRGIAMSLGILAMVIVLLKMPPQSTLDAACGVTLYPATCKASLLAFRVDNARSAGPKELTRIAVEWAARRVSGSLNKILDGGKRLELSSGQRVCDQTLGSSLEQLYESIDILSSPDISPYAFDELKTRLSAAMEFHTTCIDTLMETGDLDEDAIEMKQCTERLLSNALALVNALSRFGTDVHTWKRSASVPNPIYDFLTARRLLNPESATGGSVGGIETFPSWMSDEQQAFLNVAADPPADVVVAKDGSGKFKSIQAAIDAAPKTGRATASRYVIRIKAGVYDEQVTVPKQAANFMFIGDGAAQSIITGDRSVAKTPGMTTFNSATLSKQSTSFSHST